MPADLRLLEGDYLEVDRSALTGESLPAERHRGEEAHSGSIVRRGKRGVDGFQISEGCDLSLVKAQRSPPSPFLAAPTYPLFWSSIPRTTFARIRWPACWQVHLTETMCLCPPARYTGVPSSPISMPRWTRYGAGRSVRRSRSRWSIETSSQPGPSDSPEARQSLSLFANS